VQLLFQKQEKNVGQRKNNSMTLVFTALNYLPRGDKKLFRCFMIKSNLNFCIDFVPEEVSKTNAAGRNSSSASVKLWK